MDQHFSSKASVLIVDDNEANLIALKAALDPLDQDLICVHSGLEALRVLLQRDVAAVVLDVQMPGMNGLDVAETMSKLERTRHVPIIFVTAMSRETAWVMKGYEFGGADYLLKPVDPYILASKVRVFVDLWRRGKLLEENARALEHERNAKLEAERAAQLEQELMAIVAHDIRSPLSAIAGTAMMLKSRHPEDEVATHGHERIIRGTERLSELSALLLDYARARTGRRIPIVRNEVDVGEVCRSVAADVAELWPGTAVITPDAPVIACVDGPRVRQLLTNLLENAAKHGPPDGRILVSARMEDGMLVLAVHNDGEPLAADVRDHLFEPFGRSTAAPAKSSASVGLGLYIVKVIAEAHDGTVTVDSTAGMGTTFSVRLASAAELCAPSSGEAPMDA